MRDLFGNNPDKLKELLHLREHQRMSYNALGTHFNLDHTTIMHAIRRFAPSLGNIKAARLFYREKNEVTAEISLPALPPPKSKYQDLIDDECVYVNPGKLYRQYKKENKLRTATKRAEKTARLRQEFEERVKRRGRISWRSDGEF